MQLGPEVNGTLSKTQGATEAAGDRRKGDQSQNHFGGLVVVNLRELL